MFAALCGTILCSGLSTAAVTITLTGSPSSTVAEVSVDGSLTLRDSTESRNNEFEILVTRSSTSSGSVYRTLGLSSDHGSLSSSPFLAENFSLIQSFPASERSTAAFEISDTSSGGAVLTSGFAVGLNHGTSPNGFGQGEFRLVASRFPGGLASLGYPDTIDDGDILTFNGGTFNYDLSVVPGPATFSERFTPGIFSGDYDGQDVIFRVVSVPEPSSLLCSCVCGMLALTKRRR